MPTNIKLNNLPIDKLTAIADQLQVAVKSMLNSTGNNGLPIVILNQCKRLLCRSQEWRSKAFFVIVVGPVKSGKSTFVNLLAHEKVSPTHFLECTVRPSIISRKSDENKDSLITPFLTEGEPSIEHVDTIIDYIKGLEYADLSNIKEEEPCVLNKDNLDNIHSAFDLKDKGRIALTAITAKGGDFLQDNIYMIDMPGFDGVMANLNASSYKAIVDRADLVVFVQSSNSAINKISEDFCKMIQERNDSVPIYFVHNYFDSSYWHTKEERDRVTDGHIEKALRFFEEHKFTIKSDDMFRINLGKVTDARNISFMGDSTKFLVEYKDVLLQEEGLFVKMEHELHEKMCSSQSRMRLQNCINRTIKEATILFELLNEQKLILGNAKEEYDNLCEEFEKLKSDIKPIETNSVLNMTDKLSGLIAQLQNIENEFVKNINKEGRYKTYSVRLKANDLIKMYVNSTKSYINSFFNPEKILKEIYHQSHTDFIEKISQALRKYDRLFEAIRIDDQDIEIDYSSIYGRYNVNDRIKKKKFFYKYKGGEVVDLMSDVEHELFGLSLEHACGYIPLQFFPDLRNRIEDWIGAAINKYRDEYNAKVEEERIKALKEIIPNMAHHANDIRQIESYIKGLESICNKFKN